ncbi:MAG TPA: hypothetical protein VJK03_04365 [Candidatus Nanoarchaeia archaeon]|nr:hypothetical protein [Candidatus Nanoarchaeia archaeon]
MAKNKKKGPLYKTYTIEKTLKHHVIEWSATVLSVAGAIVNAIKYIEGFYIFAIANMLWMSFAIKHRHWGLLIMNIIFFFINAYALYIWYSDGFGNRFF